MPKLHIVEALSEECTKAIREDTVEERLYYSEEEKNNRLLRQRECLIIYGQSANATQQGDLDCQRQNRRRGKRDSTPSDEDSFEH